MAKKKRRRAFTSGPIDVSKTGGKLVRKENSAQGQRLDVS